MADNQSSSEQIAGAAAVDKVSEESKDDQQMPDRYLIEVSSTPPSLEECVAFVSSQSPECGAVSTFQGLTRNSFGAKKVVRLSYEAYTPMAVKVLRSICDEASTRFPGLRRVAVVHVVGDCPVGRASVTVCASSPHRRDAIDGVSYVLDELKAKVPIWKLEVYEGDEDGAVWKENVEWKDGVSTRVMRRETTTTTTAVSAAVDDNDV